MNKLIDFNPGTTALVSLDADPIITYNQTPSRQQQTDYMMKGVSALIKNRQFEDAFDLACLSLWVEKDDPRAHNAVGLCLREWGKYDEAIEALREALRLVPSYVIAAANLASILIEIGPQEQGMAAMRKIVAENPDLAVARMALMAGELSSGNLEAGWKLYHERRRFTAFAAQITDYKLPEWDGKSKERVLVVMEEGPGERIMFSSMIPDMISAGATPVIDCSTNYASMGTLFKRSFPGCEIAGFGEKVDVKSQVIIGDMGKYYRNNFFEFPKGPFLFPDMDRVEEMRRLIDEAESWRRFSGKPLVVGISWHSRGAAMGAQKSIPMALLSPLLGVPNIKFVSLQYELGAERSNPDTDPHDLRIVKIPGVDVTKNFDDLAALAKACDLVITISNSVAHVAGAVGVPTWLLLPGAYGRNWFWFFEGDTSPWYSCMKIWRQNWREGWQPLVNQVADELRKITQPD